MHFYVPVNQKLTFFTRTRFNLTLLLFHCDTGGSPILAPKSNAASSDKRPLPLKVNLLQFRKNVSDLRMQLHQMRQLQAGPRTPFRFDYFNLQFHVFTLFLNLCYARPHSSKTRRHCGSSWRERSRRSVSNSPRPCAVWRTPSRGRGLW